MALPPDFVALVADLPWPAGERPDVAQALGAEVVPVTRADGTRGHAIVWDEWRRWVLGEELAGLVARQFNANAALARMAVILAKREPELVTVKRISGVGAFLADTDVVLIVDAATALHLLAGTEEELGMPRDEARMRLVHLFDLVLARVEAGGKIAAKVHAEPSWIVRRWGRALEPSTRSLLAVQAELDIVGAS